MIYFALAKGRLGDASADLLERCGADVRVLREKTRKLVLESGDKKYGFFLVKPSDVPTYVEAGGGGVWDVGEKIFIIEGEKKC